MTHGWRVENGGGETNERLKEAAAALEVGQRQQREGPGEVGHEESMSTQE